MAFNIYGQVVGTSVTAVTASGFPRDPGGRLTAINRPGAAIAAGRAQLRATCQNAGQGRRPVPSGLRFSTYLMLA
jgi:hypothetical protein